jgi:DNA-binding MarR family transcriptional regulator
MAELAEAALIALRRILRVTEARARSLARDTGLTASQVIVLRILAHAGKANGSQIAERAGISQATVSTLLDKLEAGGLARRKRGGDDRRQVWVELTAAGRSAVAEVPDLLQERFTRQFQKLASWEQAYLVASLERITALLDASEIDASPVLDVGAIDRAVNR